MNIFDAGLPNQRGRQSGKPLRVVTYTSGSGTFTPLAANSWCRVTLIGGGGGGSTAGGGISGGGGGGGGAVITWVRIPSAVIYTVGAGGTAQGVGDILFGLPGGTTTLASLTVSGGGGGQSNGNPGAPGVSSGMAMASTAGTGTNFGGLGGNTMYGAGGAIATNGTGFGSGGGGRNGGTGSAANGAAGLIIIEEFGP